MEIKQCQQFGLNYAFYEKMNALMQKFNGNLSKETKTELKRIYNKIGDNESISNNIMKKNGFYIYIYVYLNKAKLINKDEMVELNVYKPMKDSMFSQEVLAEVNFKCFLSALAFLSIPKKGAKRSLRK